MAAVASELGHWHRHELPHTSVPMVPGHLVNISAVDLICDILAPASLEDGESGHACMC